MIFNIGRTHNDVNLVWSDEIAQLFLHYQSNTILLSDWKKNTPDTLTTLALLFANSILKDECSHDIFLLL